MIQLNNYKILQGSWETAINFLCENDCYIEISQERHIACGLYEISIVLKACFANSSVPYKTYPIILSKQGQAGLNTTALQIANRLIKGDYAFPADLVKE